MCMIKLLFYKFFCNERLILCDEIENILVEMVKGYYKIIFFKMLCS